MKVDEIYNESNQRNFEFGDGDVAENENKTRGCPIIKKRLSTFS